MTDTSTRPAVTPDRVFRGGLNAGGLTTAAVVAVLVLLGFFWFPGHTYLQQDTQIYVPMLERLWDPSLFSRELLTSRPHLAFTIYDETAFVLRHVFHAPFEYVLEAEQMICRALGLWGVVLAAGALGLERRFAFLVAALFGLGATIIGPAVLTFEYEPVPRGFSVMLVVCAIGLAMQERFRVAATVAAVAFLFHPPTTVPFWMIFAFLSWRVGRSSLSWWAPLAVAGIALFTLSRLQPGILERQVFFGRIDPSLERLQRIRAPYNWIDLWPETAVRHYIVLAVVALLSVWRLRTRGSARVLMIGLTVIGIVAIPVSYLVLDVWHWAVMPQYQPARAVLFVTVVAVLGAAMAGVCAALRRRWLECAAWFIVPVLVPLHKSVADPLSARDYGTLALCVAAIVAAVALARVRRITGAATLAAAVLVVYAAIPTLGRVQNYPHLWTQDLVSLSKWARTSTDKNAMFHFVGAGKALYPGIFRSEALRAVYVDWKAGGQVNYFKSLADEWWSRWQEMALRDVSADELKSRGIDYAVTKTGSSWHGGTRVYSNGSYDVYRL